MPEAIGAFGIRRRAALPVRRDFLMAGLVPAIRVIVRGKPVSQFYQLVAPAAGHALAASVRRPSGATWMAVTSPAMTRREPLFPSVALVDRLD